MKMSGMKGTEELSEKVEAGNATLRLASSLQLLAATSTIQGVMRISCTAELASDGIQRRPTIITELIPSRVTFAAHVTEYYVGITMSRHCSNLNHG
jgi:hypothetical protein